ncbi:hypothetical protein O0L34_g8387 [Tuta absoluta]|nr:hypothetical protein O0L34_g8387 [Tuta absoluta]
MDDTRTAVLLSYHLVSRLIRDTMTEDKDVDEETDTDEGHMIGSGNDNKKLQKEVKGDLQEEHQEVESHVMINQEEYQAGDLPRDLEKILMIDLRKPKYQIIKRMKR